VDGSLARLVEVDKVVTILPGLSLLEVSRKALSDDPVNNW
jgi:hypothetical protein